MAVKIDKEKCTACGACAEACPVDAIIIKEVAIVDQDTCIECGVCVNECPEDAIKL